MIVNRKTKKKNMNERLRPDRKKENKNKQTEKNKQTKQYKTKQKQYKNGTKRAFRCGELTGAVKRDSTSFLS